MGLLRTLSPGAKRRCSYPISRRTGLINAKQLAGDKYRTPIKNAIRGLYITEDTGNCLAPGARPAGRARGTGTYDALRVAPRRTFYVHVFTF